MDLNGDHCFLKPARQSAGVSLPLGMDAARARQYRSVVRVQTSRITKEPGQISPNGQEYNDDWSSPLARIWRGVSSQTHPSRRHCLNQRRICGRRPWQLPARTQPAVRYAPAQYVHNFLRLTRAQTRTNILVLLPARWAFVFTDEREVLGSVVYRVISYL